MPKRRKYHGITRPFRSAMLQLATGKYGQGFNDPLKGHIEAMLTFVCNPVYQPKLLLQMQPSECDHFIAVAHMGLKWLQRDQTLGFITANRLKRRLCEVIIFAQLVKTSRQHHQQLPEPAKLRALVFSRYLLSGSPRLRHEISKLTVYQMTLSPAVIEAAIASLGTQITASDERASRARHMRRLARAS